MLQYLKKKNGECFDEALCQRKCPMTNYSDKDISTTENQPLQPIMSFCASLIPDWSELLYYAIPMCIETKWGKGSNRLLALNNVYY